MKLALADIPIYVTHYTRLHDRRERLDGMLSNIGVRARWLTRYDREDVTSEIRERYYRRDDDLWRQKTFYASVQARGVTPAELSLAIKHIEIYRDLALLGHPYAMVLEDDVILPADFRERFDACFAHAPDDLDLSFFGNGCGLRIPNPIPGTFFYRKETPATRCTDSYLVTAKAAERILQSILPLTLPIDLELNYQIHAHAMNVYWLEPPLVEQGSQNGSYCSSIQ